MWWELAAFSYQGQGCHCRTSDMLACPVSFKPQELWDLVCSMLWTVWVNQRSKLLQGAYRMYKYCKCHWVLTQRGERTMTGEEDQYAWSISWSLLLCLASLGRSGQKHARGAEVQRDTNLFTSWLLVHESHLYLRMPWEHYSFTMGVRGCGSKQDELAVLANCSCSSQLSESRWRGLGLCLFAPAPVTSGAAAAKDCVDHHQFLSTFNSKLMASKTPCWPSSPLCSISQFIAWKQTWALCTSFLPPLHTLHCSSHMTGHLSGNCLPFFLYGNPWSPAL